MMIAESPSNSDNVVVWFGRFFSFLKDKAKNVPVVALWGGGGSGKSHAVCQELIDRMFDERDIRILVTRKSGTSLEMTTFQMIVDILTENGYIEGKDYHLRKTRGSMSIRVKENILLFSSMDDERKKRSLNTNYIYIEEATEFTLDEYLTLLIRARRHNHNRENQIFLSFNPSDEYHWTKTEILDKADGKSIISMHSTFKDNPRLPESAKRALLSLKDIDEAVYTVYAEGKYAVIKTQIYNNFDVVTSIPALHPIVFGMDFGYNNPSALVSVSYTEGVLYVRELLYSAHLNTAELIDKMKLVIPSNQRGVPIYADAGRPDTINDIAIAGFNIHPAKKPVKEGIDKVKQFRLKVVSDDINLLRELRSYKWREDRSKRILDEPVKMNDHLMDAMRYAVFTSEELPSAFNSSQPLVLKNRPDGAKPIIPTLKSSRPGKGVKLPPRL
jgi:phage terminase large subunit